MIEITGGLDGIFDPEPLHPDLQDRLRHIPGLGLCLQHPYVYSVPYHEPLNKQLNLRYAAKLARLEETYTAGNWPNYIGLHERPYRINALMKIEAHLSDPEFWKLLANTWIDSENIRECYRQWMSLWHSRRPGRAEHVMEEEERSALAAMPDPLVIFRGVGNRAGVKGLSWTLDPAIARRLGSRYGVGNTGSTMIVARGVVQKHHVLAYFSGRNEEEIVVIPGHVHAISTRTYPRKRSR